MIESLVGKYILPKLSEFFDNLDTNSFKISLWSGKVSLQDLSVNPRFLDKFKLPIILKSGTIGNIDLELDWKSYLTKPKPTIMNVKNVNIVLTNLPQTQWSFDDSIFYEHKVIQLKQFFLKKLVELSTLNKKDAKNNSGYLASIGTKVVDNIQLNLQNIKISLETENFTVGITLDEFKVVSTNSNWEETFIQREEGQICFYKRLTLSKMGLYLNITKNKLADPNAPAENQYIIKPISLSCNLIYNNGQSISVNSPRYSFYVSLDSIDIEIKKSQYDCLVEILNAVSLYSNFRHCSYNSRKYLYFKPKSTDKKKNAKEWLRFLISMIVKQIQFHRGKEDVFSIPKDVLENYKKEVQEKYFQTFIEEGPNKAEPSQTMKEAIEFVDIELLTEWIGPLIAKKYAEDEEKKVKSESKSSYWNMFGYFSSDTQTNSEIQELVKMIQESEQKYIDENSDKYKISFKYEILLYKGSINLLDEENNEKSILEYKSFVFMGMRYGDMTQLDILIKKLRVIYNDGDKELLITETEEEKKEEGKEEEKEEKKEEEKEEEKKEEEKEQKKTNYLLKLSCKSDFINNIPYDEIDLKFGTINIIYHSKFFSRIVKFFVTRKAKNELKDDLYDKMQAIYQTSSLYLKDKIKSNSKKINIALSQRKVMIMSESQKFAFSLGEILIKSPEQEEITEINGKKFKKQLEISLSKIGVTIGEENITNEIMGEITVSSQVDMKSKVYLNMKMNNVDLMVTKKDYLALIDLPKLLTYKKKKGKEEEEFYNSESKIDIESAVFIKEGVRNQWVEYYSVLRNRKIYFFSKRSKTVPVYSIYLGNGCTIKQIDDSSFKIKNSFGWKLEMKLSNKILFSRWFIELKTKINEIAIFNQNFPLEKKEEKVESDSIMFGFFMSTVSVSIFDNSRKEKFFLITLGQIEMNYTGSEDKKVLLFSLQDTYILDQTSTVENLKNVISCNPSQDTKKFIYITVTIINKKSYEYKQNKEKIIVTSSIGGINVIYNPLIINNIIRLLTVSSEGTILASQQERQTYEPNQVSPFMKESDQDKLERKEDFSKSVAQPESKKSLQIIETNCENDPNLIKIEVKLELIGVTFVNVSSNTKFFEICFNNAQVNVLVLYDHFCIESSLNNVELFDLTNYPNTVIKYDPAVPIKRNLLFSINSKDKTPGFSLYVDFYQKNCPLLRNQVNTKIKININGIYLVYIQQQIMRLLSYLLEEVINSVTYKGNESAKNDSVFIPFVKREKINLKVEIKNSSVIFKENYSSKKEFIINFDNVTVGNNYHIVEQYYIQCFQIKLGKSMITTEDGYQISNYFTCVLNIHNKEKENILLSHTQLDFYAESLEIKLRLKDYVNIILLLYNNFCFSDEHDDVYYFNDFNKNYGMRNVLLRESSPNEKYINFSFYLIIPSFSCNILFKEESFPFTKISAKRFLMEFVSFSSGERTTKGSLEDLVLYEFLEKDMGKMNQILFTIEKDAKKKELEYQSKIDNSITKQLPYVLKTYSEKENPHHFFFEYITDSNDDSFVTLSTKELKMNAKFDILYLIYGFFISNLPSKNKTEVTSKFRVIIKLEKLSICMFKENEINQDSDVICLFMENFLFLFDRGNTNREREAVIQKKKGSFTLSRIQLMFSSLNFSICKYSSFLKGEKDKRVLINSFDLNLESKAEETLSSFEIKFFQKTAYSIAYYPQIELNISFRDLMLLHLSTVYEMNLISKEHLSQLAGETYENIFCQEKEKDQDTQLKEISSQVHQSKNKNLIQSLDVSTVEMKLNNNIHVCLINDDKDTYYPFFELHILGPKLNVESFGTSKILVHASFELKSSTYNYIAAEWEPLIEDLYLKIEIINDNINEKKVLILEDKTQGPLNVNVSDLALEFLFLNLNKWKNNYYEYKKTNSLPNHQISNHKIFNYTGKNLLISTDKNKGISIPPNESYDLIFKNEVEYFFKKKDKNVKYFQIGNYDIRKNKLNLDNIRVRKIDIYDQSISNMSYDATYNCMFTKVELNNLKKFIYFTSPLSFKNLTSIQCQIKVVSKPNVDINISLGKDQVFGVPLEYLNGTIEILPEGFKTPIKKTLYNLLSSPGVLEEISGKEKYIILYCKRNQQENSKDGYKASDRTIYIRYSYCLKNCLPFDISLKMKGEMREIQYNIKKGELVHFESVSFYSALKAKISIPNIIKETPVVLYNNITSSQNQHGSIDQIKVQDYNGNTIIISALLYDIEKKMIVLYSSRVLINFCGDEIKFYYRKDSLPVPSQINVANIFILSPTEEYLYVRKGNLLSEKIEMKTLGNVNDVKLKNDSISYRYILESQTSLVDVELNLYSKVYTFRPKYYIFNKTSKLISVSLDQKNFKPQIFHPNQKEIFDYFGQKSKSFVTIRPFDSIDEFNKGRFENSYPFILKDNKVHSVFCSDQENLNNRFNITIERHNCNNTNVFVFAESNKYNAQIYIENKLEDNSIKLFQNPISFGVEIKPGSDSATSWAHHYYKKEMCLVIEHLVETPKSYLLKENKINNQKLPLKEILCRDTNKNKDIFISFEMSSYQLHVVVGYQDNTVLSLDNDEEKEPNIEFQFFIKELSISLISDNKNLTFENNLKKYQRRELCNILISEIRFLLKMKKKNEHMFSNNLSFLFQNLKIGGENEMTTFYPMILMPLNEDQKEIPFFNSVIDFDYNTETQMTYMSLFNFSIQEFELRIESSFIFLMMSMIQNFTIGTKTSMISVHPIFVSKQQSKNYFIKQNYIEEINHLNEINSNNNLFIETLEISSVNFILSFLVQTGESLSKFKEVNVILFNLLSTFSNVKNIDIKLNGCNTNKFVGTYSDLFNSLFNHYKSHLKNQTFKLLTGIEIFGNPNSTMKTLSEGVIDLYKKPKEGFRAGPLQGIVGIAEGGVSLVKHTVEGVVGSTSGVISDISKGILTISLDEEYINKREKHKLKEKPTNVITGIGFGFKSLGKGILSGVTGLVEQPIKSVKESKGIEGLGKGLLKGFGGLISKPISGALDLVSKTTEGIKNNVRDNSEIFKGDEFLRTPRPFYGKFKILKKYSKKDAEIARLIKKVKPDGKNLSFCNFFEFEDENRQKTLMILTTTKILFFDGQRRKPDDFFISYNTITNLRTENKVIFIFQGEKRTKISLFSMENPNDVMEGIKEIMRDIDENCLI